VNIHYNQNSNQTNPFQSQTIETEQRESERKLAREGRFERDIKLE
jgi:hypothetical protein